MDEIVTALSEYLTSSAIPILSFDPAVSAYGDRAFGKDLGKIIKALQQNYSDKVVKLILLMDEMDVMNTYDQRTQSQLRSVFQKDFVRHLGAMVAGINLRQKWERYESPFYNMFTPIVLEPFSPEQARELITKPVEGHYIYEEPAIERILVVTGGHPFRLQQLCLEVTQHAPKKKQRRITLADIEKALATIHWIEDEINQAGQESAVQSEATATPIVAEKPGSYNASISTQENEEPE